MLPVLLSAVVSGCLCLLAGRITYIVYPAANERVHALMLYVAFLSPPLFFLVKQQFGLSAFLLSLAVWMVAVLLAIALFWRRGSAVEQATDDEDMLLPYTWELSEKEQSPSQAAAESASETEELIQENQTEETLQHNTEEMHVLPDSDQVEVMSKPELIETAPLLDEAEQAHKEIAAMAIDSVDQEPTEQFIIDDGFGYIDDLDPIQQTIPEAAFPSAPAEAEQLAEGGEPDYDIEHFFSKHTEESDEPERDELLPTRTKTDDDELISDLAALLEPVGPTIAAATLSEPIVPNENVQVLQMDSLEAVPEARSEAEPRRIEEEHSRLYELEELMQPRKE